MNTTHNSLEDDAVATIFNWHRYYLEGVELFDPKNEKSILKNAATLVCAVTHLHPADYKGWKNMLGEIIPDFIWERANKLAPGNVRIAEIMASRKSSANLLAAA